MTIDGLAINCCHSQQTMKQQRVTGNETTNDWKWHSEWLEAKQKMFESGTSETTHGWKQNNKWLEVAQRMVGRETQMFESDTTNDWKWQRMIGNDGDNDDDDDDLTHW